MSNKFTISSRCTAKFRGEGGIYIVVLAGVSAVLLSAVLLYVMMGAIAQHKTQQQKIADVAALAALEGFTEVLDTDEDGANYSTRSGQALTRARKITQENNVKFASQTFAANMQLGGPSDSIAAAGSESGMVRLGRWLPKGSQSAGCPSDDEPCLVVNPLSSPDETVVNAAEVTLCNTGSNPISLFTSFVQPQYQCSTGLAILNSTCIAFAIDASFSTTRDTHYDSNRDLDVKRGVINTANGSFTEVAGAMERIVAPLLYKNRPPNFKADSPDFNPSITTLPFFPASMITGLTSPGACDSNPNYAQVPNQLTRFVRLAWCSMGQTRPLNVPANERVHYRNDYEYYSVPGMGGVYYDHFFDSYGTYFAPQPMGNVFMAVNAALRRIMERSKTGADKAMMLVFQDKIISKLPENGMTNDLGYMIQLTNLNNRGTKDKSGAEVSPRVEPNFMNMQWFPLPGRAGGTNIPLALDTAVDVMRRECSPGQDRVIMLFSDGMSTCARESHNDTSTWPLIDSPYVRSGGDPDIKFRYQCANPSINFDENNFFTRAESQLIGSRAADVDVDFRGRPTILKLLKDNGIRMVSVLAGKSVAPHEVAYLVDPDGVGSQSPHYMTQDEAYSLGYGGAHEVDPNKWFGTWASGWDEYPTRTSPCSPGDDPASCAMKQVPRLGAYWAYPNRIFSSISLDTGGYFCPLRPLCSTTPRDPRFAFLETPACPNPPGVDGYYYDHDSDPSTPEVLREQYRNRSCTWPMLLRPGIGQVIEGAGVQFCAVEKLGMSEQSAKCAIAAVGANPYNLISQQIR